MKLSNPRKLFFVSLLACLFIWIIVSLFFWRVLEAKNSANVLAEKVANLSSQKAEIKNLALEMAARPSDELNSFIIGGTQEDVVSFIELIESLVNLSDLSVKINSVAISKPSDESLSEDYELLNLTLEVSGDWSDIYYFLSLLEHLPYKLTVGQINLEKLSDNNRDVSSFGWQSSFSFSAVKLK